jgi:hypothetical protein
MPKSEAVNKADADELLSIVELHTEAGNRLRGSKGRSNPHPRFWG